MGGRYPQGASSTLPFFAQDPELFALFARSLLCGAQVNGWGPFIFGTDVVTLQPTLRPEAHTPRPWQWSSQQPPCIPFTHTNAIRLWSPGRTQPPCHPATPRRHSSPRSSPRSPGRGPRSLPAPPCPAPWGAFTTPRGPGPDTQLAPLGGPAHAQVTPAAKAPRLKTGPGGLKGPRAGAAGRDSRTHQCAGAAGADREPALHSPRALLGDAGLGEKRGPQLYLSIWGKGWFSSGKLRYLI